ncbi:MAG: uroporphyrinogen decarboxylase family protein [Candidatus Latescibacterota bacterium]
MNGKERIQMVCRIEEPDRVPVMPITHYHSAALAGITIGEYARSGEKMAAAVLKGYERFGWDGFMLGCDVGVEGEALGGTAEFPDNAPPNLKSYVLENNPEKLKDLKVPNPLKDGRMPVEIRATEICIREVGGEAFVQPYTACPMTCASQLRGVQTLMMDTLDDPVFVEELLDFTTKVVLEYGKALVDAGAHCVLLGAALCSPQFTPPQFYQEKILPRHQKLIAELKEYGAPSVDLHVCGNIWKIVPYMAESGADMFDVDWQMDMVKLKQELKGKGITLRGNINPALIQNGTQEEVYGESVKILESAGSGGGMILGSGCDVAVGAPYENLDMMIKAAKDIKFR